MKCPKCGYVSFDFSNECKKCRRDLNAHKKKFNIYIQMATPLNIEEYQKIISEERTHVKDMPPQSDKGVTSAKGEHDEEEISTAILDVEEKDIQELDVLDLNINEPITDKTKDLKTDDNIDLTINLDEKLEEEGNIELSGMLNIEETAVLNEDLKLEGIELNINDNEVGNKNKDINLTETIELQSSLDMELDIDNKTVNKKITPKPVQDNKKEASAKKDESLEGIEIDFGNIDLS